MYGPRKRHELALGGTADALPATSKRWCVDRLRPGSFALVVPPMSCWRSVSAVPALWPASRSKIQRGSAIRRRRRAAGTQRASQGDGQPDRKTPFAGAAVSGTVALGASGGQNFTANDGGNTTNSSESEFLLNVPAIDVNRGYQIGTSYYYDTSGTARVAMGADVTSDAEGSQWWRANYASPDVALNQPGAMVLTTDPYNERVLVEFNTSEAISRFVGSGRSMCRIRTIRA